MWRIFNMDNMTMLTSIYNKAWVDARPVGKLIWAILAVVGVADAFRYFFLLSCNFVFIFFFCSGICSVVIRFIPCKCYVYLFVYLFICIICQHCFFFFFCIRTAIAGLVGLWVKWYTRAYIHFGCGTSTDGLNEYHVVRWFELRIWPATSIWLSIKPQSFDTAILSYLYYFYFNVARP